MFRKPWGNDIQDGSGLLKPQAMTLGTYRFNLELTGPVSLPAFKGDVFHRLLGWGLGRVSSGMGNHFFRPRPPPGWPRNWQTPPKPFLLIPSLDEARQYGSGDTLELGITLFGLATQHLSLILAALETAGSHPGLSHGKGRFRILSVEQITPRGLSTLHADGQWLRMSEPVSAADIFVSAPADRDHLTLYLLTRLRLKARGVLARRGPPLAVLCERLLGRLNTLAVMYCGGPLLTPAMKHELITLAGLAAIMEDDTCWSDWSRDQGTTRFGGLLGRITYGNVPGTLLPWLCLGQWTGVGGKTSFGLGLYALG